MSAAPPTGPMSSTGAPAFVCTYCPPGFGKTVDCGYSFARGLFIAAPGALKPIKAVCKYNPDAQTRWINSLEEAEPLFEIARAAGLDTVVFDDFSYIAESTFSIIETRMKADTRTMYRVLNETLLNFRNWCRWSGLHVVLNCWEKPMTIKNGMKVRGGPKLPGALPESMPALCDLVLRGSQDSMRKPWPGVYLNRFDPDYIMKDRDKGLTAGCPEIAPMNLGEILRFNGYTIGRHAGLPWQEEAVEKIATVLVANGPENDMIIGKEAAITLLAKGYNEAYVVWTLRDALDRAALRRSTRTVFSAFGF